MGIIRTYQIAVPQITNQGVIKILSMLNSSNKPTYINVEPDIDATIDNCFFNVQGKTERTQGGIVYGWVFWEHPYMIEAEFHAVWKSPDLRLVDITPRMDPSIDRILFVVDEKKKFTGPQTDNIRVNTTDNELVDDMIDLEKAKYRFLNKGDRASIIGEIYLEPGGAEAQVWEGICMLSFLFGQMYERNETIYDKCFCNSGVEYKDCHRQHVQVLRHYR